MGGNSGEIAWTLVCASMPSTCSVSVLFVFLSSTNLPTIYPIHQICLTTISPASPEWNSSWRVHLFATLKRVPASIAEASKNSRCAWSVAPLPKETSLVFNLFIFCSVISSYQLICWVFILFFVVVLIK